MELNNLKLGVYGGLAGGLIFGAMMGMMVGFPSAVAGFAVHLMISALIGISFAGIFGRLVRGSVGGLAARGESRG